MDADVGLVVELDLFAEAELDFRHDGANGQRVQRATHHLGTALEGPVVGHGNDLVGKNMSIHLVWSQWDTVIFFISMSQYFSSNFDIVVPLLSHPLNTGFNHILKE